MTTQEKVLKWARQSASTTPLAGARIRRAACRKLAGDRTAQAVPFLVSALASGDEDARRMAEEGLKSLEGPEAIEALYLGYLVTRQEPLRQILDSLGRATPDAPDAPTSEAVEFRSATPSAEKAWQFENSRDQMVLAFIPEGDSLAGDEPFRVHLPAYYLALACVTNAQYARFLGERRPDPTKLAKWIKLEKLPSIQKDGDTYTVDPEEAELSVRWVSWEGADAYCRWAGLRLPTELEWEKGARGVDGRQYPWGDEWEAGRPHPAPGQRKTEEITSAWAYPDARSPFGLYQMIGNVYEWCFDWYEQDAYKRYAQGDLRPPRGGEHRALRGGPWRFGTPVHLRTEYRKSTVWRGGTMLCGFRCAKSL